MKYSEVNDHIGRLCTLNGFGDLMMEKSKYGRYIRTADEVEWPLRITKATKSGLVQLQYVSPEENLTISVPVQNIELLELTAEGESVTYHTMDEFMNKELKWLRHLYLEDLGKEVCYDGHNKRPRVRHIGNWERIRTTLTEGMDQVTLPLDEDDKRDVWIWSDLHFFHKNIIEFSERPYDNMEQMHEHLIANHNEIVKPDDIVIWVGDVAFGGDEAANEILDQCNGYKILIVGNHDFNKKKLRNLNFNETHLLQHFIIDGVDLVLTHYPMENLEPVYINVHGHVHAYPPQNKYSDSLQHINVNCEFQDFKPINIMDVVRRARMRLTSTEQE